MAEHAYNTATSESTKISPFFAHFGFNPDTQCVKPAAGPTKMEWPNPASEKQLFRWQNIRSYLQDNILWAQEKMAKYDDVHAQNQPTLKPGNVVMVNMKNTKTTRPSKKLDHKRLGLEEVLEAVGK